MVSRPHWSPTFKKWPRRSAIAALSVGTFLLAIPHRTALARVESILAYPMTDVWPSAIRFLRIDRGYTIKEKDDATGYVLFELTEGGRTYRGAMEFIFARDPDGRNATKLFVQIPELPRRFEQGVLEKLVGKIRDDHGLPPPPAAPKNRATKRPQPDAGSSR